MKKTHHENFKILICITMTVSMATSSFSAVSFASESENIEEEVLEVDGFQELKPIETEYKLGLDRLKEDFPEEITATAEDGSRVVVKVEDWIPVSDYDESLGTYEFEPVVNLEDSEIAIADGIELPVLTVAVENEDEGAVANLVEADLGYEVPELNATAREAIPSKYDGYGEGYLPVVRDQGQEGCCWAFASIGVVETDLIKNSNENKDEIDLSELHLSYFETHSYDDPKDCHDNDTITYNGKSFISNGGTSLIAYRIWENGAGPVEEKYAPYSLGTSYVPADSDALMSNYAKVETAYNIPLSDSNGVKKAILEHGSVTASFYADRSYYSATYNSFYGTNKRTNHEIMLVGWDDSFSKENFTTNNRPAGNGAWLVRNSWGLNDYGYNGYFWISYYDAGLLYTSSNQGNAYVTAYDVSGETYANTYSYAGQIAGTGTIAGKNAIVSVDYSVEKNEIIKAIGIETGGSNNKIEASVTDGTTTSTGSVETTYAGYYTIKLDNPLAITKKQDVTVTLNFSQLTSDSKVVVLVEKPGQVSYGSISYFGTAEAKNQSIKVDGSNVSGKADVRMALYTDNDSNIHGEQFVAFKTLSFTEHAGANLQLELTEDSTVDIKDLTFTSTEEKVATVSTSGLVTLQGTKGSAVIRGTYKDTATNKTYYAECSVTTKPYQLSYEVDSEVKFTTKNTQYYPGDAVNSVMSTAYKAGYNLEGWYLEAECETKATDSMLYLGTKIDGENILKLYPKWEECELTVSYQKPSSEELKEIGKIKPSMMPFSLEDPTLLKEIEDFDYFSLDEEGKNKITEITIDNYNFREINTTEDKFTIKSYENDSTLTIYPQLKSQKQEDDKKDEEEEFEKGELSAPTISMGSRSAVADGTRIILTSSMPGAKIFYSINGGSEQEYSNYVILNSSDAKDGVIKLVAYAKYGDAVSTKATAKYEMLVSYGDILEEDKAAYDKLSQADKERLWITGVPESVVYTGENITFSSIRVYYGTRKLTEKTDYIVSYQSNKNVINNVNKPTAVIIRGKGGYSDVSFMQKFSIVRANIDGSNDGNSYSAADIYAIYNKGKLVTGKTVLYKNGRALKEGVDYTVSGNQLSEINKDGATVTITGIGNYDKELTVKMYLSDMVSLSKASIKVNEKSYPYAEGKEVKPNLTVKVGKKILTAGTDYDFAEGTLGCAAGKAVATIYGKGEYAGSRTVSYTIAGTAINTATIKNFKSSMEYVDDGVALTQSELELSIGEKTLTEGKDYTLEYKNNNKFGAATLIITGIDGYSGTVKKSFKITKYNISSDNNKRLYIELPDAVAYTKGTTQPIPNIYYTANNKRLLKQDIDYAVSYSNNKRPGTAIMTITGKGNFSGKLTRSFTITNKSIDGSDLLVVAADRVENNKKGGYKTSFYILDSNGKKLAAGVDYDSKNIVYSYEDRLGEHTLTGKEILTPGLVVKISINGKGYYTGTTEGHYRILDKGYDISKYQLVIRQPKNYTGAPVYITKDDIEIIPNSKLYSLTKDDIEIVSYSNNIKKGTAKVVIRGNGARFGGTKTLSFKIVSAK